MKQRGALSSIPGRFESLERETFDDGWCADDETPPELQTTVTEERARSIIATNESPDVSFEQSVNAQRNETIGRVSWTRSNVFGFSFEAGAEAAYNTLDDQVDLFSIGSDGSKVRIDLPIANATVKEKRGEIYMNVGRNLSPSLRIDGGVNYEFSNLTVSGDATADRTLKFLKPNLTLDWKPGGGWHTQLSVRRTVAQLNFYDFISFGDLSTKRVTGSNAELVPQRAWEFRATVEHPILGDGLFKLDVGHDLISKLQDQILIFDDAGNAFSGPGNRVVAMPKRHASAKLQGRPANG